MKDLRIKDEDPEATIARLKAALNNYGSTMGDSDRRDVQAELDGAERAIMAETGFSADELQRRNAARQNGHSPKGHSK
jgi:hypothetical protein